MVATQIKPISFEEFLEWYPEGGKSYELIEGMKWKELNPIINLNKKVYEKDIWC